MVRGRGCETRREPGPYALPALQDTSHIHVGRPWGLITDIHVGDGLTTPSPHHLRTMCQETELLKE